MGGCCVRKTQASYKRNPLQRNARRFDIYCVVDRRKADCKHPCHETRHNMGFFSSKVGRLQLHVGGKAEAPRSSLPSRLQARLVNRHLPKLSAASPAGYDVCLLFTFYTWLLPRLAGCYKGRGLRCQSRWAANRRKEYPVAPHQFPGQPANAPVYILPTA